MTRLIALVQIGVTSSIFYFLYSQVDIVDMISILSGVGAWVLGLALVVNLAGSVVVNVLQVHVHLDAIKNKSSSSVFLLLLKIDLVNRFYSLVVPTVGTAVIKAYSYKASGIDINKSVDLVVVNKLMQFFVACAMSTVVLYFYYFFEASQLLVVSGLALISVVLAFSIVMYFKKSRSFYAVFFKWLQKVSWRWPAVSRFIEKIQVAINSSEAPQNSYWPVSKGVFFQLMSIVLVAYSQYLLFSSLNIGLGYDAALVVRCLVQVAMLIPISYAGFGVREVSLVAILGVYGVDFNAAIALASVLLIFQILISFLGGLYLLFDFLQKSKNIKHVSL